MFVLIGKSGVGKSNFLLALDNDLSESGTQISMLMYDGAQIPTNVTMSDFVAKDFNDRLLLGGQSVQEVWHEISKMDDIDSRTVILCVDAINENAPASALLQQFDQLAQEPWPWLKIVFSSRPETWQSIKRGVKLSEALYYQPEGAESLGVALEPFNFSQRLDPFSRQELPDAFAKYQAGFDLQSTYDDIPLEVRELIREPLNLWLVAKTYQGKTIPKTLHISELIQNYLNTLLESGRLREMTFAY